MPWSSTVIHTEYGSDDPVGRISYWKTPFWSYFAMRFEYGLSFSSATKIDPSIGLTAHEYGCPSWSAR